MRREAQVLEFIRKEGSATSIDIAYELFGTADRGDVSRASAHLSVLRDMNLIKVIGTTCTDRLINNKIVNSRPMNIWGPA